MPTPRMHVSDARPRHRSCINWGNPWTHLISYILFEIFVCCDINAYTPFLEPFCLDLVGCAGHSTDHSVWYRKTFFKWERARVRGMMREVLSSRSRIGRTRSLCIFLQTRKKRKGQNRKGGRKTENSPGWCRYRRKTLSRHHWREARQADVLLLLTCAIF